MVTVVILIVVAIVGAVVGVKATQNNGSNNSVDSRYPDYSKLNYTLVDTCKLADVPVEIRHRKG